MCNYHTTQQLDSRKFILKNKKPYVHTKPVAKGIAPFFLKKLKIWKIGPDVPQQVNDSITVHHTMEYYSEVKMNAFLIQTQLVNGISRELQGLKASSPKVTHIHLSRYVLFLNDKNYRNGEQISVVLRVKEGLGWEGSGYGYKGHL